MNSEDKTNTVPNNRTGLWVRESKSGNKFLGGNLKIDEKEYSIKIFKNTKKETTKQPDYTMFYDLKEEKQQLETNQTGREVTLTDEDYDKLLEANQEESDSLELPF